MDYLNYFDKPEHLNVDVLEEDLVVGHADAKYADGTLTLEFAGVRETHRKRGIATEMLTRLIDEGRRRGAVRIVGERIRSAASWRRLVKLLGNGVIQGAGDPTKLPEQPETFYFAPSFDILQVEISYELTAEWPMPG